MIESPRFYTGDVLRAFGYSTIKVESVNLAVGMYSVSWAYKETRIRQMVEFHLIDKDFELLVVNFNKIWRDLNEYNSA